MSRRADPERLYIAHRMALSARLVSEARITPTLMIESGEDIAVISRILGHATLTTTADIYAHLTPATSQRVADRMDAILGAAATA